jgi:hypothetical protein
MKVFMVHAFKDFTNDENESKLSYESFKKIVKLFNPEIKLSYLKKKGKVKGLFWKCEAARKIKESNFVLFINNSDRDLLSKYINWELKYAYENEKSIFTLNLSTIKTLFPFYEEVLNYLDTHNLSVDTEISQNVMVDVKKILLRTLQLNEEGLNNYLSTDDQVVYLREFLTSIHSFIENPNQLVKPFQIPDDFTGEERPVDTVVYISNLEEEAKEKIGMKGLQLNENKEFENLGDSEKMQLLLEQYKIFVHSSETLMQRRQAINSFYVTANTVLVALFAAVVALKDVSHWLIILSGFFLSGIGIVITKAWKTLLLSYGKLNSSKIKVISAIEKRLPVSLYDLEWSVMSNDTTNGGYKPFTKSEAFTASTFFWLYIIAFVGVSLLLGYLGIKEIGVIG